MKLIIFDCDGTLVDSQRMICAAMRQAYEAHGLLVPQDATLLSIVGLSLPDARAMLDGGTHPERGGEDARQPAAARRVVREPSNGG